jgi:hypothetical protein
MFADLSLPFLSHHQVRLTAGRDQVLDEVLAPQALKVLDDENTRHANAYKWTIIKDVATIDDKEEYDRIGLIGFRFDKFTDPLVEASSRPYLELVMALWPGDWEAQLVQMNAAIESANKSTDKKARVRAVTKFEWWRFIGILISACPLGKGGVHLWESQRKKTSPSTKKLGSTTDYGELDIMKYYRFREIKRSFPYAFYDLNNKQDPWHPVGLLVDGFNDNRSRMIAASIRKILDETMLAFQPQTTALGGLPFLSFILRKPKPLGTEGKVMGCGVTGT